MYKPQPYLLEGLRAGLPLQRQPWDEYFRAMAEVDVLSGSGDEVATKSFFIRKAPFGGSYALLGGITEGLRTIADLPFNDGIFRAGSEDLKYDPAFIDYFERAGRLQLQVYAPPEGSVFFPNEPIVTVVGPLPHIRFAEGILTEALNFATLSMTKWHRLVRTVRPGTVLDFSRRRAQNHFKAALYGLLAGCASTSNAELRRFFDVLVVGTMGHEWIQRFGDVRVAFDMWLRYRPNKAIGLVDTKQCLEHDFPAWLEAVWEHREAIKAANPPIWGWRNDSGDLAYLTIEQYRMFLKHQPAYDPWFRERMRIVLTNDLDEYAAQSIIAQIRTEAGAAGIDAEDILRRIIWAAGTRPGTCDDQPSLGGVLKLMQVENYPCIKLAFDHDGKPGIKTSIPGNNRSAIVRDASGIVQCVLIYRDGELAFEEEDNTFFDPIDFSPVKQLTVRHPDNPNAQMTIAPYTVTLQQQLVYDSIKGDGFTKQWANPTIASVRTTIQTGVDGLHWSQTRLDKPHPVKVSLSEDLYDLRQRMIEQGALRSDKLT